MHPWLSAQLADERRHDARRSAQRALERRGRPRPPRQSSAWATSLVEVPYTFAILSLPRTVRSDRLEVELAPVLLTARAKDRASGGGLRVLVHWRRRWRRGSGYLDVADAGSDGVEVVLHLEARLNRRLGAGVREPMWAVLDEIRRTMTRAAPLTSSLDRLGPVDGIRRRRGLQRDTAA
jgi:hypothetical protein